MTERVKAHRERMKAAGWKQSAIWLPPKAVAKLSELCKTHGLDRQEVIARLIVQADKRTMTTNVQTAPEKKPIKKKGPVARKKKKSKSTTTPSDKIILDDIGLLRSPDFHDSPGAVSVNSESKDFPKVDTRRRSVLDWRSHPRKFMAVWEAKKHIGAFKKKHASASINQRYMDADKSIIEITASYPAKDMRPDQRVVYQARNR